MNKKIYISKANQKVVEVIRQSISDKKERHQKLMQSIDPAIVENLQKMKKIELTR